MSSNRKLIAEVDRVLKRIVEGNELFDDIWDKVHTASQQNQKEKYEQDLKKEIKKLQRLREQVKTWATNADIRNKDPLLEARRSVEERMEKFKELEREMKTKAYSREGLSKTGKLSAEEQAQEDCKSWISERIEEIQNQLEAVEADVESLSSTVKRKAKNADKIKELEDKIATHKWHMTQLEMIIRAVDNGVVEPEEVDDIKDDIVYYIESNQEPDFYNDDTLYDPLELEERMASQGLVTTAVAAIAQAAPKEKKTKKEDESEGKKKKKKDKSKKKKDDKEAAETDVLLAQQQQRAAILEQQKAAQKARKEKEKLELARQREEEAKRKEAEAREAQQAAESQRAAAAAATAQKEKTAAEHVAGSDAAATAAKASMASPSMSSSSSSSSATAAATSAAPAATAQQQQQQQQQRPGAAPSQPAAQQHPSPTLPPPQGANNVEAASVPTHSNSISSSSSKGLHPPPEQPSQQPPQPPSPAGPASSFGSTPSQAPQGPPAGFTGLPESTPLVQSRPTRQITLPGLDLRQKLAMLDSSLLHIPGPAESERTKTYTPRSPFSTPSSFPATPPASFASAAFMEKLDPDTLFFIFFHQPNTHQQYLAARELKRQSWRYHKKYHTWFQRHEEPRTTTDEYEVGTYVYFDFETNWGQRIKPNFTFEYAFLEDEVPTASPKSA